MKSRSFTPRVVSVSRTVVEIRQRSAAISPTSVPSPYVRRNLIVLAERCHQHMSTLVEHAIRRRDALAETGDDEPER